MVKDWWTKFVKKKLEKTEKNWIEIVQKTIMKMTKTLTDKFSSNNVTKKRENIFQTSSPTLYLGIVIIKNQRLAIFVRQETAFGKEDNWPKVIWHTAEKSKATQGVFLSTDFYSTNDTTKRENRFQTSSPTLYLGIVIIKKQRLTIFVRQETAFGKEDNWSEVECVIRRDDNGDMIGGAIQKVNLTAADFHRINVTMKRGNRFQTSSPSLYLGIVILKNNV